MPIFLPHALGPEGFVLPAKSPEGAAALFQPRVTVNNGWDFFGYLRIWVFEFSLSRRRLTPPACFLFMRVSRFLQGALALSFVVPWQFLLYLRRRHRS
jgi:hypothetical protein